MSGFEALGMASSVLQVISFAASTAKLCKAIYDGAPVGVDVCQNASSMMHAAEEMKAYSRAMRPDMAGSNALLEISEKCHATAKKLQREVDGIQTHQGKRTLLSSARMAIKSLRKKDVIEQLQKTLEGYQATMETYILLHVW